MGKNKNYPQEVRNMGFYLGSIARPRRFGQTQGRMMKSIHILNITWMMSEMILH